MKVIRASGTVEPVLPDGVDPDPWPLRPVGWKDIAQHAAERSGLPGVVNEWRRANYARMLLAGKKVLLARRLGIPTFYGQLWLRVFRANGDVEDLGLASLRVVTNAGVAYMVDAFQNLTELENLKFHGIGTGATAEAVGDTALVTESTTALNPDSTRATGSTTEAAANIYRTVGTNTVDASVACTEHGIFSQAATGGGTLLDRSVFSVVNLASGDSLQTTYDFTIAAGS
jgi:hypothetical protein